VTLLRQHWGIKPIWGIPLSIELSFIPSIILWSLLFSRTAGDRGLWLGFGMGTLVALALFASVLMHEVGRGIIGRGYGLTVKSIILSGSGCKTFFHKDYQRPLQQLEISLAGSLFNLHLFVLLRVLDFVHVSFGEPLATLVEAVKVINITLGLFYLIPGLPLDGAQVLNALIWKRSGSVPQTNLWQMRAGYASSAIAIAVGLYYLSQHAILGGVLLYMGVWTCLSHPQTVLPELGGVSGASNSPVRQKRTSKQRAKSSPRDLPQLPNVPNFDAQFLPCADANERFSQGMHYIENQKYQAAITIFSQVLQANRFCAEGLHNRGNAYLKVGDYTNALEDFKTAIRRGFHHSETYLGQGLAYIGTGDRQGGIMAYSEAIRINAHSLRVYVNRGNAYASMAQYEKAIADYQSAENCCAENCSVEPWEQECLEQVQQALARLNYDKSVQS
jgi:Zn-dependent protease